MATIVERKGRDGERAFQVKVRLRGFPTQTATFSRLTDARKWASSQESAFREGRHFGNQEARKHTLSELVDRYIRDILPLKPKSLADQKRHLLWWKDRLGHLTLAQVTPATLAEARDELARGSTPRNEKRSPSTVVRYLAALSHAFSIATREWGWMDDNPVRRVTKPKEPRGRIRFLSDDERKRLLAACRESDNPHLYPAVVLSLSTGARQQEIMTLRWDQVDLQRGRITLYETKNKEIRALPVTGHAADVLGDYAKVRRIDSALVFPGRKPDRPVELRKPWLAALKKAEIADFRWHDLRHSAASYLAMNGASLAEIAAVLGHKTLAMVKRYAHIGENHTTSIVERMNAKIFG